VAYAKLNCTRDRVKAAWSNWFLLWKELRTLAARSVLRGRAGWQRKRRPKADAVGNRIARASRAVRITRSGTKLKRPADPRPLSSER
jgi:hypothetical protein